MKCAWNNSQLLIVLYSLSLKFDHIMAGGNFYLKLFFGNMN